ncbi:MAG: hypothetical protein KAQ98_01245 [Bacteriovoracaceae bacterium]|nr:hypothetical protein [Bacteriovoracaceae bacterium]
MTGKCRDVIQTLLGEAQIYSDLEQIEKFVQEGRDLRHLPVQPLYMVMKKMPVETVAKSLDKFSQEQREAFLDLDLWEKDNLDVENFSFWPNVYSMCPYEHITTEFVKSEEFLLFLKGRFNIWTFDCEDPNYPDHDNYFLTDDNLLLFEFDDECKYVDEIQKLIRHFYSREGVENAYSHLFKMVSDSYSSMQEEEYKQKKERLIDYGFIDYYDALELDSTFVNLSVMNNFIKKKQKSTANLDNVAKCQALHSTSVAAYRDGLENIGDELGKVGDTKRLDYLQFNFIRLVNGTISRFETLKSGQVAMTRTGLKTRSLLNLGLDYIRYFIEKEKIENNGEVLFELFDFIDCFKIGNTLTKDVQKKIKSSIAGTVFEGKDEYFLGSYWTDFLFKTFDSPVKINLNKTGHVVSSMEYYKLWEEKSRTFTGLVPYVLKFFETFAKIRDEGRLQDSFYFNYAVDEIDFEAIIISSLANHMLGNYKNGNDKKMGITVSEFKKWAKMVLSNDGKLVRSCEFTNKLAEFSKTFGFDGVHRFVSYLEDLLVHHIEGYELEELSFKDFKHVGGPIILVPRSAS